MRAAQSSVLVRFFTALALLFRDAWPQSALGGWFHRRKLDLLRSVEGSGVFRFLTREGALTRGWATSKARTAWRVLWNLPVGLARWLERKWSLWRGSRVLGALGSLGRRAWLLMGLFALLMLAAPHEAWENLYALVIAVGVAGLFVLGCTGRKALPGWNTDAPGPYFLFYVIFITAGFVGSLVPALSMRFFLFHLTSFFIFLVMVSAVQEVCQLRAILVCAAVGLTLASLYGCYQGYVGVEVLSYQQDLSINPDATGRIYSFFDNPNNFAEILVMLLPLVGALTLNAKGWRGRVLGVIALALGVAAIGMTLSRSGWVGLVLAVLVFLALQNWRFIPLFLLLGVAALPFLPQSIWNRLLTIGNAQDTSAVYRLAIYEHTGYLLRDYGLTGVGLGNDVMREAFKAYPVMYVGDYPIHTHSNYFQMWGETGLFGLLAYLGLVLGQIKGAVLTFRQSTSKELRRILAAAVGGLCGILVIGFIEYTWFYPRNMFLYWLLLGVIAAAAKLARKEAPAPRRG